MKDNRLEDAQFFPTPNMGGCIEPELIVIHYSSGRNMMSTVRWFSTEKSKASSHILIGRDGKIVQMVPFNMKAYHAGRSECMGRARVNDFSISIEMCNWGPLQFRNSMYISAAGMAVYDESVVQAVHQYGNGQPQYWERYTDEQMEACVDVCKRISAAYKIKAIVGHDEIAVPRGRVYDPGPAFNMTKLRNDVGIQGALACASESFREYGELLSFRSELEIMSKRLDRVLNGRDD